MRRVCLEFQWKKFMNIVRNPCKTYIIVRFIFYCCAVQDNLYNFSNNCVSFGSSKRHLRLCMHHLSKLVRTVASWRSRTLRGSQFFITFQFDSFVLKERTLFKENVTTVAWHNTSNHNRNSWSRLYSWYKCGSFSIVFYYLSESNIFASDDT